MKKLLFPVSLLLFVQLLNAQEQPIIVTDRPSQSAASSIVPAGKIQVESGYIFEQDDSFDGTNLNFLVRWGLNEFVELRFQQDYLTVDAEGASTSSGLSPTKLGLKTVVAKEEGWMPEVALLGSLALPSGESDFQTSNTTPEFAFAVSKSLSDRWSIGYNLGMRWDDDSPEHTTFYTIILGLVVSDKLAAFFEPYGFLRQETKADSRINGGVTYLLKPTVQLDLSGGVGLTDQSPDSFVSFGGSIIF